MRILIAPDSFKDSLSALEVANSVKKGILLEQSDAEIRILPMADGGEGTVASLVDATDGKIIKKEVYDPLGRKVKASFGILGDGETAIIEMASASGIELLSEDERNPWVTSTYGTGQLIIEALNRRCDKIVVGVGGSATNDGGVGMAKALGYRFLNKEGKEIGEGGGEVGNIQKIDDSDVDERIAGCKIRVACDVTNPFVGPKGASYVYGPQKGADPEMVKKLDKNLTHLRRLMKEQLKVDIKNKSGSGAAGGLAGGLIAFAGARLKPGFALIREMTNLDEHVIWADLVITGEGKIDYQTQFGKTPMGVASVARYYEKKVVAIAGTLGEGYQELYDLGFDAIFSVLDKPMSLKEALLTAPQLIQRCSRTFARLYNFESLSQKGISESE